MVLSIPLGEGDSAEAGINVRPGLSTLLAEANKLYQIITFTASDQQYADTILDALDCSQYIDYRLYRHHCVETPYGYLKDLRIIANREMEEMVLVDNSVLSFAL